MPSSQHSVLPVTLLSDVSFNSLHVHASFNDLLVFEIDDLRLLTSGIELILINFLTVSQLLQEFGDLCAVLFVDEECQDTLDCGSVRWAQENMLPITIRHLQFVSVLSFQVLDHAYNVTSLNLASDGLDSFWKAHLILLVKEH